MCGWCTDCLGFAVRGAAGGGVVGNVGGIHRADQRGRDGARRGVRDTDPDPELYAWILVLPIGLMLQQSSLRVGALTASLPTITVARPVIASVLGITVLDEVLHTGRVALVALVAAVVVVVVATVALARDEVAMMTVSAGGWGPRASLRFVDRLWPMSAGQCRPLSTVSLQPLLHEAESARQGVSFVLC